MDEFTFRASIGVRPLADRVSLERFKARAADTHLDYGEREDGRFAVTLYVTEDEILSDPEEAAEEEDVLQVSISLVNGGTDLDAGTFDVGHRRILGATQLVAEEVLGVGVTGEYAPHYLVDFPSDYGFRQVARLFNSEVQRGIDGEEYFTAQLSNLEFRVYSDGTVTPLHEVGWPSGQDIMVFVGTANNQLEQVGGL